MINPDEVVAACPVTGLGTLCSNRDCAEARREVE